MKLSKKLLAALVVAVLAIAGLDQLTKALVAAHIPRGGTVPLLPGVVHLTYTRNEGAAWSLFSGFGAARWLFLALVVVFLVLLCVLIKKGLLHRKVELWCMAAIAGGAIGNAIDRAVAGSVVDMIELEFIEFPVFNVGDSFITCGVIVFIIYLLFFSDREKKDAPTAEQTPPAEAKEPEDAAER